MNTVIKQIKRCFTIYSALFITLITTRVRGHQHCGHEQLVQCSKPLSIITDSGLTFVSSKADLDRICPDLKEALKCIHGYTRKCMSLHHRKHFKQLFHGTGVMVHELCNNSTYQDEYLKYGPCMKAVAAENQVCFSRYQKAMNDVNNKAPIQNESDPDVMTYQKRKREAADEGVKNVCCSFQEYVQCATHTMRRACGDEAAEFSRTFHDRMSSSMIKLHCSQYGAKECGITASASAISYSLLTMIVTVFSLLRYSFS